MLLPSVGETVKNLFYVVFPTLGPGHLYLTNLGVYLESSNHQLMVKIPFDVVVRYSIVAHNKIRFDWLSGNRQRFCEIIVRFPKEIYLAYQEANIEYSLSMSEANSLKLKVFKSYYQSMFAE